MDKLVLAAVNLFGVLVGGPASALSYYRMPDGTTHVCFPGDKKQGSNGNLFVCNPLGTGWVIRIIRRHRRPGSIALPCRPFHD